MNIRIRESVASVFAAVGLTLGLLGGSAVVPNVAHAATPGTYDYATQRVCFTVPTYSGVYPYSYGGPVKLQIWWNGGPYTVTQGRTDAAGCVDATYMADFWWRITVSDEFTTSISGRHFYGATSNCFWVDGGRSSYPTATIKMSYGSGQA